MINPKFILPILIVVTLTVMVMPERWHYSYEGRVTDMVVEQDSTCNHHSDGTPYYYVQQNIVYHYKTPQGKNMTRMVEDAEHTYSHSYDFIVKNNNERIYSYRWWWNVWIWIGLTVIWILITLGCVSGTCQSRYPEYPCEHCPLSYFCFSDDKKTRLDQLKKGKKSKFNHFFG